jgi:integrase
MAKIVKRTIASGGTRYVVDYYDLTGKRRKERHDRERDAKARLGEVLAQRRTGELRPRADDVRLRQLVADWRLEHWPRLRPNTHTVYGRMLDKYILPELGERKLRTLMYQDCERVRARAEEAAGRATGNLALTLLRMVLGYAEKHRLIAHNPARHVRARPAPREEQLAKIERDVLSPAELRALFENANGKWRAFLMVVGLTGLRKAEALGLQWGDIDWASNTLRVRRQLQGRSFAQTKSAAAVRTVPMLPELVAVLKPWRLQSPKAAAGSGTPDLVFATERGGPLSPNAADAQLAAALRRAPLRHVSMHTLRHGYASMLISAGAGIKVVQRLMGHSSIQMTLQTYAHLLPEDSGNAARALSALVFGAAGSSSSASAQTSLLERTAESGH